MHMNQPRTQLSIDTSGTSTPTRERGTLIELLVVLAVIGVLLE